ncbi:hypothetical protein [Hamadaea tsunoensis]|uniref:hypothetical protein n=1 Tax=Hamadaea tsunoensis TaxID=53368 RepID=UPI000427ED73|nr:hypothetical protein [Hamadaea tsunoensis]
MRRPWHTVLLPAAVGLLAALGLAGTGKAAASAQSAQVVTFSTTYTAAVRGPGGDPEVFTAGCQDGVLLGGGMDGAGDAPLHVVLSYPADADGIPVTDGETAARWAIGVQNAGTAPVQFQVVAVCLTGTSARSTVRSKVSDPAGSDVTLAVSCPASAARTGGGYWFVWPTGSAPTAVADYPTGQRTWTVQLANLKPVLRAYTVGQAARPAKALESASVFAVCVTGTGPVVTGEPGALDFDALPAACPSSDGVFAPQCTSHAAVDQTCAGGRVPAGGGWRYATGTPPSSFGFTSMHARTEGSYRIEAHVATDDRNSFALQAYAICLKADLPAQSKAAPPKRPPSSAAAQAAAAEPKDYSGITGAVCLAAVAVGGLFLLARRRQPRLAGPATATVRPQAADVRHDTTGVLQVVVRAQRQAYRNKDYREQA